ncbi:MAG: uridine kinase [Actinomycetota bacterium]
MSPADRVRRTESSATRRPFVIGVAGGTCSGKTTVAERLVESIGDEHLALIRQDAYYIDRSHQPFEDRAAANYDHPDAFDWDLMARQLGRLLAGETVPVPVYDYADHNRSPDVQWVGPAPIIVFEGILALFDPTLRDLFDLKIYVDTDADIRLTRRLQRDVTQRGRTYESILKQYLTTVRPSHEQFIEPSKRHADVIFPEGGHNDAALDVLVSRVRQLLV